LGFWLSNAVLLNLILTGPAVLIGLAFGEIDKAKPILVGGTLATEGVIFAIIMAHIAVQSILDDVAKQIIEKIDDVEELSKMLSWVKHTWSIRYIFDFALPFCLLWSLLGIASNSIVIHQFAGFGFSFWCIINGFLAGLVCHVYFWTCLFISNLKVYQYEINSFSPADSEIISNISKILTKAIYMLAIVGAVFGLVGTSKLVAQQNKALFSIPILVITWALIIAQFILTRSTLDAITNRAKWATLNKLRKKINMIEATGDLSDRDTAERLLRLADLHKQIMASKTNTFDLKSVSTLFSQLMLPLLGLLLGNLDKLSKLLP